MKSKLTPVVLAALLTVVGSFEGLRLYAYKDPVGIPTICFGHTKGVHMGDVATKEQCAGLLEAELHAANAAVDRCITRGLTDGQRAALVSLTYNVGPRAVCGSTIQRYMNSDRPYEACGHIKDWKYARGVVLPGIVKRREVEYNICLGELSG